VSYARIILCAKYPSTGGSYRSVRILSRRRLAVRLRVVMESVEASDFTVVELRDALRERGLPTKGAKSELIERLSELDPNIWMILSEERNEAREVEGTSSSTVVPEVTHEPADGRDNVSVPERRSETLPLLPRGSDNHSPRELELIRREKELLAREQQLIRREREMMRGISLSSNATSTAAGVRSIRDLLPEFDASENTFWKWRKQLELLRNSYRLDDESTRLLISMRLKGRAHSWLYSKTEYVTMGVDHLLEEMAQMFHSRPGMLQLRKVFEARTWRANEKFCDYYHEKVILANQVPVAEEELLDYIVDGITDKQLQRQVRLQDFPSREKLLKAFEKLTPDSKTQGESKQGKDVPRAPGPKTEASSTGGKTVRCYKCHEVGHVATHCRRRAAPGEKRVCFVCGSAEHMARDCSERKYPATSGTGTGSAQTTSTNVIQPAALRKPYMVTLKISPSGICGNVNTYVTDAIIDSGSPISIIRDSVVRGEVCYPVGEDVNQFCGINGSRLNILSIFHGDVEIQGVRTKIKFFTVPDNTMAFKVLLGRDFLACPLLRVTLGDDVKVENVEETSVVQILSVAATERPSSVCDELQINPAIDREQSVKIREIYESCYLRNLQAEERGPDFEMSIVLKHGQPISSRPRRLSFADKEALRKILDELLEKKIIRVSNSPYASPIVLVRKKTGDLRLCVDFRELNKITVRDNFPTELIDDNIDRLRNKKYFTVLDLKDGFHHVKMHEASIKFTSFVTPIGQYEYLRMPFGLTNAPRVFQRFIHAAFEKLVRENKIILYLDDILVATESMDEHLMVLAELFELAGKSHLLFRVDKCYFAQTEVKYLGYCVNAHGIRPSDENIESILNYPIPRNVKEIHRFVGLASYFRRFVPNFSLLARPLYQLIKKNAAFTFGVAEHEAFETLKRYLSSKPVLAIYSPAAETELHCDASSSGFGAILLQKQSNGLWKPIFFWSQRTTPTEAKYHSFELECLAAVYALKRFHVYLAGQKFKIVTDCDSFRLTLNKKDVNPRISR